MAHLNENNHFAMFNKTIPKKYIVTIKNISVFISNYSTFGRWYVCGSLVGRKNGKEIQDVEEIVYAFSFIRIIYRPKNHYIYYD